MNLIRIYGFYPYLLKLQILSFPKCLYLIPIYYLIRTSVYGSDDFGRASGSGSWGATSCSVLLTAGLLYIRDDPYTNIHKGWDFVSFFFEERLPALPVPSSALYCLSSYSKVESNYFRKDFLDTHASLIGAPAIATSGNVATLYSSPAMKRRKLTPPPCERVMIYVRQENELAFTPLHLVPPTSLGLLDAVSLEMFSTVLEIMYFSFKWMIFIVFVTEAHETSILRL